MKKITFTLMFLFIFSNLFSQIDYNQFGGKIGEISTGISNLTKEAKIKKLRNQKQAIDLLKESIKNIETEKYDIAFQKANDAMEIYPKYSLSYLIMAFVYEQNNDFVNSNRMINQYDNFENRTENKELNSIVPVEFINLVKENNSNNLSKIDETQLKDKFDTEPWINNTIDINLIPSLRVYSLEGEKGFNSTSTIDDLPEFLSENIISLNYKKYFWFSKKNSTTYNTRNKGICLNGGFSGQFTIPTNDYLVNSYNFYINPSLFINKFSISLGEFRYSMLSGYSEKITDDNVFYYMNENSTNRNLKFYGNPEIRFYPGIFNAYATDVKKLKSNEKHNDKFRVSYLFLKFQGNTLQGINENSAYTIESTGFAIGMSAIAGKNRLTEGGFYFGYGSVTLNKTKNINDNSMNENIYGTYWNIGFTITKRIY